MKQYDHKKIEKKWQRQWKSSKVYETQGVSDKPKFYVLDMFPYPSGEGLHVGHPKGYIATDIVSRMKRMQGMNVLHPMGFDAFGLPAENYAIKTKTNPAVAVAKNVARYKKQLEILGFDYDWSREVNTTDPKFYKWTQWAFLKMYEKGLAYESFEPINWCPSCKTGLANEDVEDGKCERCSTPVEKKSMRQWVIRITDYAERLLADLESLDWPESIKESQRNWIGRSEGAELDFELAGASGDVKSLKVFTTRPDTLYGVTYVVVAPEHALVTNLMKDANSLENRDEVLSYVAHARMMTEIERTDAKKEKSGVELRGVKAINPVTKEEVPVFVADYVLAEYGTGAVMAVPAHDERDFEFAAQYKLPVKTVIIPRRIDQRNPHVEGKENVFRKVIIGVVKDPNTGKFLCLKWKQQPWTTFITGGIEGDEDMIEAAVREIFEETGYDVKFVRQIAGPIQSEFFAAHKDVNRTAHTWTLLFELKGSAASQISAAEAAIHDVAWLDLKEIASLNLNHAEMDIILDRLANPSERAMTEEGVLVDSGRFTGILSSDAKKKITDFAGGKWVVKYKLKDWVFSRQRYWGEPFPIMHDGDAVVPVSEADLPVVLPKVESYEPSGTGESPLATIDKWVNVKLGKGKGAKVLRRETNTMPQWAGSSWYYLRFMDPRNDESLVGPSAEKYWNQVDFYVGGAEHATRHLIYARFWHKFLYDMGVVTTLEPFKKLQSVGLIMGEDGRKMSKRFGNVVNPDDIVEAYGADTMRVYEMFMGPFDQAIAWSTTGMVGSRRFIERVWKLAAKVAKKGDEAMLSKEAEILLNKTVKKVTEDISSIRHNTAVSSLMILSNELEKAEKIPVSAYAIFLQLLAPFAPHVTEELWGALGKEGSIHASAWPVADESKLADEELTIAVQVNGKVRATFKASKDASKGDLEAAALALDEVKKWVGEARPDKVIVVPGRMVSIVIKGS